jgi:hypothetical protein
MSISEKIAFISSGICLMIGLLTGVWKYLSIMNSPKHQAPVYVDIAHRAALMYAFACLVLLEFARVSDLPETLEAIATAGPIAFFLIAIFTYIALGISKHTENQFEERNFFTTWGTRMLIVAEVGGFGILLYGAFRTFL